MTEVKILHCQKHDIDFNMLDGCPQCLAEKAAARASVATDQASLPLVKVKYRITKNAGTDKEYFAFDGRPYTYYTAEPLVVGDVVEVPVQGHTIKAQVVEINVPEAEIAAFKDKVKTIPAGSKVQDEPNIQEAAAAAPEVEATVVEYEPGPYPPGANDGETNKEGTFNPDDIQGRLAVDEQASAEAGTLVGDIEPNPNFKPDPPGYPAALAPIEHKFGPPTSQALFQLYQEAVSLLDFAKNRVIAANEDLKPAANDLAIISKCRKAMEDRKKKLVGPIKAELDKFNQAFNDLMAPILEADRVTRQKVTAFDQEQRRKAAEAQRIEDEKYNLAQDEMKLKGEHTQELGTAPAPPPVPEHTRTDLGTLGGRANWKAKVVDFKLLPDEYKLPNEQLLNTYARTHKGEGEIPGVEFYDARVVTMRTK